MPSERAALHSAQNWLLHSSYSLTSKPRHSSWYRSFPASIRLPFDLAWHKSRNWARSWRFGTSPFKRNIPRYVFLIFRINFLFMDSHQNERYVLFHLSELKNRPWENVHTLLRRRLGDVAFVPFRPTYGNCCQRKQDDQPTRRLAAPPIRDRGQALPQGALRSPEQN